ncbi:MAG: UDP-N-acetylglucosamine 1-carboxyvinyltransferase [Candidatus Berkelbacteria bacterium]
MAKFRIIGRKKLSGNIAVSGAKNAALKLIPAAIMADSPSEISNVPDIIDIRKMIEIIRSIGAEISFENNIVKIDPRSINSSNPDKHLVKKLRGSVVLIGPLLAKFGKATFSQPGGCLIGARAIDDHLDVLKQFGIKYSVKGEDYTFKGKPKAAHIVLPKMSVTATENAMMAAVLSPGKTIIDLAAAEPEIPDLAKYLNKMGAKITGAGTHRIEVEGVSKLKGCKHETITDRVVAGTFILIGVANNAEITVGPVIVDHLSIVFKKLEEIGAKYTIIERGNQQYVKTLKHGELKATSIDTRPYPGFPTDLQSPFGALMTQANGVTEIFETMFEGRFAYLEQLRILRANVEVENPHTFKVSGATKLKGAVISSKDIRGGAAVILAATVADGETIIEDAEMIDRGYEKIDEKLRGIGVDIERID